MQRTRSRLRRRYLLALCTFLVPLAVLAVLGQSELHRSGIQAQAALDREAKGFLASAAQAIDQTFARQMPPLLEESQRWLADQGAVRTVLKLREEERFAPLRDIIVLDEQFTLVWPSPTPATLSLPFASDARGALPAVDLLITTGKLEAARTLLLHLIEQMEVANPPGRTRRPDLPESEQQARFRLATVEHALGQVEPARSEFEKVSRLARNYRDYDVQAIGLLADTSLAELGAPSDRLKLLRSIAESNRDRYIADGMLNAVAQRLADSFADTDPERAEVDTLLREERQRTVSRAFGGSYELVLQSGLRLRRLRQTSRSEFASDDEPEERLIATLTDATSLLWLRPATLKEAQRWRGGAHVGLHLDLDAMLAPALRSLSTASSTFVLAVTDPDDVPMVPAPTAVPDGYVAPALETKGLTLRAFPANGERLIAETQAAASNRTLLMLALFVTALGGALWSWRSVSRETELADLKIDLVSRVSHELKTPLALIRMYGETLGMGRARDKEQAAHFGGIITRESERLTALIQRILDFSRQQAGTLQYERQVVDLGPLLRTVCDAYTPHLEARGVILVETLPDNIFVLCDANAFESAIVNLLENAAKYGIEGDIDREIELDLRAEAGLATIEVRDRGRGIPAAELEHVFDGFYRASNSGEVRGAGLGLSLVRHFARAHDGDVIAKPRDGGGSILRLSLPLAPAPDSSARPAPKSAIAFPPSSAPPPNRT